MAIEDEEEVALLVRALVKDIEILGEAAANVSTEGKQGAAERQLSRSA